MRRLLLASFLALCACPSKHPSGPTGGGGDHQPAALRTYAALRWVPANASYVIAGKTAADISHWLRDLADATGIATGFDATAASRISQQQLGYDMLTPDSLAGIGIDVNRGAVIYSTGLSPTFVVALADPDKLTTFVEHTREQGVSIQSQIDDGVEVFTVHMDTHFFVSWAVVDGWLFGHGEFTAEHQPELAWLRSARAAAGAFASTADMTAAAKEEPPIAGVIHPPALLDAMATVAGQAPPACASAIREVPRVLIGAASSDQGGSMTLTIDPGGAQLASLVLAAPAGWYAAREGAPVQVDLALDLPAVTARLPACPVAPGLMQLGVRTAHLEVQSFDQSSGLPTRGGGYADLTSDRAVRAMLGQIPGLSHFSSHRKVGDQDVVDVSFPMVPDFSYVLTSAHVLAAIGSGAIDAILGPGKPAPDGELVHLSLRPHEVPGDAWDLLLENGLGIEGDARAAMVARIERWDEIHLDAALDAGRVIVTVSGARHH